MREEYRRTTSKINEVTAHFLASRVRLYSVEHQVVTWKEERRLIVSKNRGKEDRYAEEVIP